MSTNRTVQHWLVIPAGGKGARFGGEKPKQLHILKNGKTILEQSVLVLKDVVSFSGVVVSSKTLPENMSCIKASAGEHRCQSVLNGIKALKDAHDDDWVWVHDAVRPMVSKKDVLALKESLADNEAGSLLATPIPATVKKVMGQEVKETLERDELYLAQTPQVMKKGLLQGAIEKAIDQNKYPTDESQALEWQGISPKLVTGQRTNIKITYPEDIEFLEKSLQS